MQEGVHGTMQSKRERWKLERCLGCVVFRCSFSFVAAFLWVCTVLPRRLTRKLHSTKLHERSKRVNRSTSHVLDQGGKTYRETGGCVRVQQYLEGGRECGGGGAVIGPPEPKAAIVSE